MKTIPSLLVVEDSPTGMKYICDFLKSINVGVIQQAFNAEDALDILRTQTFSFIITDYRLPGLNGMEFLERIRIQGNSTPAILLSASHDSDSVIRATQCEQVDICSKPFRTAEIIQTMERLAAA